VKGISGYGRYDDDPDHVGCPYAKSDMTPCIARDGRLALADATRACVGCGWAADHHLRELRDDGVVDAVVGGPEEIQADHLRDVVRRETEQLRG
jgi:hypothetical protein